MRALGRLVVAGVAVLTCGGRAAAGAPAWHFTDVTTAAGLDYEAGWTVPLVSPDGSFDESRHIAAGAAAGDVDGDGWPDLYVTRGDVGTNLFFHNRGDGTFEQAGSASGALLAPGAWSGPVFADVDGDGALDLFVGGVRDTAARLLRGHGDGTFEDVTAAWGLVLRRQTFSAAFADVDRDGDLDLALAHWAAPIVAGESTETLWRNDGDRFVDVSQASGVATAVAGDPPALIDLSFTPTFADIDDDGWPDLLMAGDFGTSLVLRNARDGTFVDLTDRAVVTDENGMGSAVGDFDGDGRLDWFVTSIWDPNGVAEENWGVSGNRLYRGLGDGAFVDATDVAGVREGYWGWGAITADLDNDADLDLVHVNGFGRSAVYPDTLEFWADPSRLFVNDGTGRFTEKAVARGLDDVALGRAVVAFDYDRDGDVDLFIANGGQPGRLLRNDGDAAQGWLGIRLRGQPPNTEGIGARVEIDAGTRTQVREVRAGNNFESANPAVLHVGLGPAHVADRVRVRWPGGDVTELRDLPADRVHEIAQPASRCGDGVTQDGWPYREACDGGACCTDACAPRPDRDGDGVCDVEDPCPDVADATQADTDGDGIGDACDPCTAPALIPSRLRWRRRGDRVSVRASLADDAGAPPIWSARGDGLRIVLEDSDDRTVDVTVPPDGAWKIRGDRATADAGPWRVRVRRRSRSFRVDLRSRNAGDVPAVERTGARLGVMLALPVASARDCAEGLVPATSCRTGRGGRVRCRQP